MATHSPILMAYPGAALVGMSRYGIEPIALRDTDHFRLLREFCADPEGLVAATLDG